MRGTLERSVVFAAAVCAAVSMLLAGAAAGEESAVGYAARMAALHEGDEPEASAAATLEPRVPVETEEVTYVDGGAPGYLARPAEAEGPLPGVVVIHEWWGLNENVEAMTRRLAGEGYVALAVDLYGGEVASDRQGAMQLMRDAMESPEQALANLKAAARYLEESRGAPRLGVIGWCFGGGWSLQAAIAMGDRLEATVIYYGRLVTDEAELRKIASPVLGLFGAEDGGIPVTSVEQFEATLESLGKDVSVHVYEGADHAFANPSGTRYDAAAGEDAWQKTVTFLAEHLD